MDTETTPLAKYCETHTACYKWFATAETWTALDATRAALSVYLVRINVRPACRVSWPGPGGWEAGARRHLGPLGLEAHAAEGSLVVAAAAAPRPDAAQSLGLWVGDLYPAPPSGGASSDGGAPPGEGTLTWVCCGDSGGAGISLWSEPLGADADLERIGADLRAFQNALQPLGYKAQVSVT